MTLVTDRESAQPTPDASASCVQSSLLSPASLGLADDSVPDYDPHTRLTARADLDRRIVGLLPRAIVRQLWLLLFDADDIQMPAMIPIGDLPLRHGEADGEGLSELLGALDREFGVASYVFVLERPGPADPTSDDLHWLTHLLGVADGRPFSVRAVYLCHDSGVSAFERAEAPAG